MSKLTTPKKISTSSSSVSSSNKSAVQVVVRLRPLNDKEKKHGTLPVITASTNDKSVTVIKGQGSRQARSTYKFNNVFTAFSTQEEVFDATLKPIIRDVLQLGYESTVFAYGQTGTGKTYTMEGENLSSDDNADTAMHGVIPRSANAIFSALENDEDYVSYDVSCSFLEIYNEELCDLLVDRGNTAASAPAKLDIMESKSGPFCRGLSESKVESSEHVLHLMRKAQQQRQVSETNMNEHSSRSHCIFTIKIVSERKLSDGSILKVTGKLHCVDLAGSECAKSAGLTASKNEEQRERERERMNINRSLLTLGRVITMLKDQSTGKIKANARIPYRDSKLTRILQESLGGRCKTCLIATVSPSVTAIEESISTLNYAQAANDIINKPITSSYMTHVGSSPSKLGGGGADGEHGPAGTEVEHWYEMEIRLKYMQSQVDEAQQALARKHLQTQEFIDRAERAEAACEEATEKLDQVTAEKEQLKEELDNEVAEKEKLAEQLAKTETALRETTAILRATQNTETCLTKEAKDLIGTLKKSIIDGDDMYKNLVHSREEDVKRRMATRDFNESVSAVFEQVLQSLSKVGAMEQDYRTTMSDTLKSNNLQQADFLDRQQAMVHKIVADVNHAVGVLDQQILGEDGGLVPYSSSSATKIRNGLQQSNDMVDNASKQLQGSWDTIREHLNTCSNRLKEFEGNYNSNSTLLLKSLAENVLESKENMSRISKSLSDTLASAREKRSKSRQALQELISEWKTSSLQSIDTVMDISRAQDNQVQETLQMLTSEMVRHDEIERYLSEQQEFLHKTNKEYLGDLQSQYTLLSKQRESFEDSHEKTKEFCQQFVSNVMTGVQELLRDQMALMTAHNGKIYDSMVVGSQELIRSNTEITASAKDVLNTVKLTNTSLQVEANAVRGNDEKVSDVLKHTNSVFGDIGSTCDEQKVKTTKFEESTCKNLKDDDAADIADGDQTIQVVSNSFEQCGTHLSTKIHKVTEKNVSQLSGTTKDTFAFVNNDIVENSKTRITNTIEIPHKESSAKLRENSATIRSQVDDTEENIQAIAKGQLSTANSMKQHVESESCRLESVGNDQKQHISEQEAAFISRMEDQEKNVLVEVSGSQTSITSGKKEVVDFSHNIILIDQDVPPLAQRVVLPYNEDLTATPPVDTILHPESIYWSMLDADSSSMTTQMNGVESLQVVEPVPVG